MKKTLLLLCCGVFLAGCVSMVETAPPEVGLDLPRTMYPHPADHTYARAFEDARRSEWASDMILRIDEETKKTAAIQTSYAAMGLDAKYNYFLLEREREVGYRVYIGQAARARSEMDTAKHLKTKLQWSTFGYDSRSKDSVALGQKIERDVYYFTSD